MASSFSQSGSGAFVRGCGFFDRRLLLLQFSRDLEALLTAAAVPASVKR